MLVWLAPRLSWTPNLRRSTKEKDATSHRHKKGTCTPATPWTCTPRTCSPRWVHLSKEGPVLYYVAANSGSVKDLYAIDLFVGDACLVKEEPVMEARLADAGSVENLYTMKGKASLGLHRQRTPVPPCRLLQECDAKPVRR